MKKNLVLSGVLVLCTILNSTLQAQQDGTLDPAFGTNGKKSLYISGSSGDNIYSVLTTPDGKIIFGGFADYGGGAAGDMYIGKLDGTGNFDSFFGSGGFVTLSAGAGSYSDVRDMAMMADGSILFGGSIKVTEKGATIGKLAPDGSVLISPTGPYFVSSTNYNEPSCMTYNANAGKVAIGGYRPITTAHSFVHDLNLDGTLNTGFSTDGTVYFGDTPQQNMTSAKAIAMLDDGSLLIAGSNGSFTLSVAKLRPDGALDVNFGNASPTTGISSFTLGATGYLEAILVLPDGKIMVAGSTNNNFVIARLNADGTLDNTFSAPIYSYSGLGTESFNSLLLQPDGKIIASGTYSYASSTPAGVVARFQTNGDLDSTFGVNGVVVVSGVEFYSSAISTSGRKLVFGGKSAVAGTTYMTLVQLKYGIQQYNILGKDQVSIESEATYQIHPVEPGYTYNWSYNGTGLLPLASTTGPEIGLYFTKNATPGTLFCEVYDGGGNLIKLTKKDLTINTEQTLAELLAEVQCDPAQTYADNSYINTFKFVRTNVGSTQTGPSVTGYSDYTASSRYDTLFTGDNYQAELECVTNYGGVVYSGLWIDYNNNGKFTDDEFAGSAASESKVFNINNIVIPPDAEEGPKRVRVRVRQVAPFTANEACIPNEELSETEDYLIVLNTYDAIEAPNFITPNNDGKNDNFIVRGVKTGLNNNLKVFNRVGDLVYQKENYDNSWGGTADSGGPLKAGTYYFVFTQPNLEKAEDDIVKGFFEIRY